MNKITIIALGFLSALTIWGVAHAGPLVGIYSTNTQGGKENSAIVTPTPGVVAKVFEVCSYNTSSALTAMVFDSATLPANGANPQLCLVPLAAAPSSTQPTCGSCAFGADGYQVSAGFTVACSTTDNQLTVDTTSGGDCKFFVAR